MTYDEFIEKYGNEKVKFKSYYKFTFSFTNNKGLTVHVGGHSDDVYKFDILADKEYTVSDLEPVSAYFENEEFWFLTD